MKDLENSELKTLALQWVTEALTEYEDMDHEHSEETLDDLWNIEIFVKNTRKRGTFGTYTWSLSKSHQNKIEIYPKNFRFQRIEDFKDTVLHELAHHFARVIYGAEIAAHGKEWKMMCKITGADGQATHSK